METLSKRARRPELDVGCEEGGQSTEQQVDRLRRTLYQAIKDHDDWTVGGELYLQRQQQHRFRQDARRKKGGSGEEEEEEEEEEEKGASCTAAAQGVSACVGVGDRSQLFLLGYAIDRAYFASAEDRLAALNCVSHLLRTRSCTPEEISRAVACIGMGWLSREDISSDEPFLLAVARILTRWSRIDSQELAKALGRVAWRGQTEVFMAFLGTRCDVLHRPVPGWLVSTPFMAAVNSGKVDLCEKIFARFGAAGCNVNAVCESGKTALMLAASKGNIDMIQLLLRHGADANMRDSINSTALFDVLGRAGDRVDILEVLLEGGACQSGILHGSMDTAAHVAATYGSWDCLMLLARVGRGIPTTVNSRNQTVVDCAVAAVRRGHRQPTAFVLQLLAEAGVNKENDPSTVVDD